MQVSPIGFGAWGIGGSAENAPLAYGPTQDEVSLAAVKQFCSRGGNFFDTSGLYGKGRSERLLGSSLPPEAVVASKAGYVDASGQQSFEPAYLEQEIEASLNRLGRSQLDLWQLHDPPLEALTPGLHAFLRELKAAGKVKALGVSLRNPAHGLEVLRHFPVDCLQVNYSLVDQRARELGLLRLCYEQGVAVIARTPLCFGFLAGISAPGEFGAQDHRSRWSNQQREIWKNAPELFGEVVSFKGSPVQLALSFCLAYPEVSVVIPGMLKPEEVDENLSTLEIDPLSLEQRTLLEECYQTHQFTVNTK